MSKSILVITDNVCGGELIAVNRLVLASSKDIGLDLQCLSLVERVGSVKKFSFIKDTLNYFLSARADIRKVCKKKNYDYILVSDYLWALAAMSLKQKKVKLIFSFHGLKSVPFINLTDIDYRQILIKLLEKTAWSLSDAITTPSKEGLNFIKSNIFFNKEKVFLVQNIVPQSFFVKKITKSKKNQFNILYSGRIGINKGLENLVTAFSKFVQIVPISKLIIAYPKTSLDKDVMSKIQKIANSNNLGKSLVFVSGSSVAKLKTLYACSDVLVLPSVIEFAPLSILESFAAGTLAIATNVGNIKCLLRKIDSNLILKNNSPEEIFSKLNLIHSYDNDRIKTLSRRAVRVARRYSESKSLLQFKKVLNHLGCNKSQ